MSESMFFLMIEHTAPEETQRIASHLTYCRSVHIQDPVPV